MNISPDENNPVYMGDLEKHEDSIMEVTSASFLLGNSIASGVEKKASVGDIPLTKEEAIQRDITDFNVIEAIPQGYEEYANMYAYVNDAEEAKQVTAYIDKLLEAHAIRNRNPITGTLTSMAAGILDWPTLIPNLGAVGAATKAGTVLRGAVSVGTTGALTVGAQEYMLRKNQGETRPIAVSGLAVASAAVFGGIIGGAAPLISKSVKAHGETLIQDSMSGGNLKIDVSDPSNIKLAGYEHIKQAEGLARINDEVAKWMAGPEFMRPISLRGVTSSYGTVKKVTNDLFEHPFILGKEVAGEARGEVYERILNQGDIDRVKINKVSGDSYKKYVGIPDVPGKDFAAAAKAKMQGKMSYAEFDIEVGKAMRRGDTHKIPEVEAVAKANRAAMEPRVKALQELGILDETLDPKTATSYFTRRWNTDMVVSEYDRLFDIGKKWFKEQNPNMSDVDLDALTTKTIENLQGIGDQNLALSGVLDHVASGGGKFTKERVWMIPDELVEDFLDSRASNLVGQWLHEADALISMDKILKKNGWSSVNDARIALRTEYETLLTSAPDDVARRALNKSYNKERKLMDNMFQIALGRYGDKPNSALWALRKYNSWRMLGGMTLSAMPDMAMPIYKNGTPSVVWDGLTTMLRSYSKNKLAKDQLQDLAGYLELESSKILRNLSEPNYKYGNMASKLHRSANVVDDIYGKATLMSYWNNAWKRMTGHLSFARTMRALTKVSNGKALPEKEMIRLNQLGIGKQDYERILHQFNTYGEVSGGSYIGNFHLWTDKRARDLMSQATLSDVNSTILTPGLGDLPKFVHEKEIGSTVFQFKTFMATATNNITIKGAQRRDAEVAQGLIGLVSLGATRYVIGELISNREPNYDLDNLLIEGISRSGVGGLMGEYILGVSNAFFGQYGSRYGGRSLQSLIGGPSADFIKEAGQTLINSTDGDLSEKDAKQIQRMLPFGNLFYVRILLNKLKADKDDN